jgi:hypothetical protein
LLILADYALSFENITIQKLCFLKNFDFCKG